MVTHMKEGVEESTDLPFFTVEEFEKSCLNSLLDNFSGIRLFELSKILQAALKEHVAGASDWRVIKLFELLTSVHFDVSKDQVYSPMLITGEGRRTVIPSDLSTEQLNVFAGIAEKLQCSLLRAFIADMVWTCDRRNHWKMSYVSCESFSDVMQGYLSGHQIDQFDQGDLVSSAVIDYLERSFQIMAGVGRKKDLPSYISSVWEQLWKLANDKRHGLAFVRVCDLGLAHGMLDHKTAGDSAARLAKESTLGYPMAAKRVWELAAYCYKRVGDEENRLLCRLGAVQELLIMRDGVSQAMAKASWTRDAIQELRQIGGQKERIRTLWNELLDFQDAALDEMANFSLPIDLSDEAERVRKAFENLDVSSLLRVFIILSKAVDVEVLKAHALDAAKSAPLSAMMGATRIDREGKVVVQVPGLNLEGAPDEKWFKHQSTQYLDFTYLQVVNGSILPALNVIRHEQPVYERYLHAIVELSPFVPLGFRENYARGFWMMFQGDFTGAAYLLVPQLENSLRYVLAITNQESSKMNPDSTQEDRSLSGLLEYKRRELEAVFGVNNIYEIDLLFNYKGGPALRHEVAHGKLTSGACHHYSTIYACWLIYRLTFSPLYNTWDDRVAPILSQLR